MDEEIALKYKINYSDEQDVIINVLPYICMKNKDSMEFTKFSHLVLSMQMIIIC